MSVPAGMKIKEEMDDIPDSFLEELGNQDFLQGLFEDFEPENDAEPPSSKVKTEPMSDEEKMQQAVAKSGESSVPQRRVEDKLKKVQRRIQERKKAGSQNAADQNPENEGDSPSSVDIEQELEKRTREWNEISNSNSRNSWPSRRRSNSRERSPRTENPRSVSREESPSRKRIRVKQEFRLDSPSPKRERSYRDASPGRSSDRRSPPTSRDRDRRKRSPGHHSKKKQRRDSRRSSSPKSRVRRRRSPLRSRDDRYRTRDRHSRSRSPSARSSHYRNRSRSRSRSPHGKRPSFLEEVKELLVVIGQQLPEDVNLKAVSKAEKDKILEEVRRDAPLPPAEAISKFLSGSSISPTFAINNSAGYSALPSTSKSTPVVPSHSSPKQIRVPMPVSVKIEPPDDTSTEFFKRRSQMESSTGQATTTSATTNQRAFPDVPNADNSLLSEALKLVESTTAADLPIKREPDPDFIEVPTPKMIKIEPPDNRPSNMEGSEPKIKVEREDRVKVENETKLKVDTTLIDMAVRRDKDPRPGAKRLTIEEYKKRQQQKPTAKPRRRGGKRFKLIQQIADWRKLQQISSTPEEKLKYKILEERTKRQLNKIKRKNNNKINN